MAQAKAKMAIITRTKNRHILLERAIKSVLDQTDKDYIHVIVNDGGERNSLDDLLNQHPDTNRIVIHNKESAGLTRALNQGIQSVESAYISILDDDDSWARDRLEITNTYFDEHPVAKGVVVFMDRIIESIEDDKIIEESRNRWHEGVDVVNLYKQCLDNYLSNGSFSYSRDIYNELDGYDEDLGVAEDWDFGIRFLLKYDVDFVSTDHALSYYHHRPKQEGDSGNSVFASIDQHKVALNQLQNKYLRQDINSGRLGVGYIMNNLRYERERDAVMQRENLGLVTRLEGHINFMSKEVIDRTAYRVIDSMSLKKFKARLGTWLKK